MLALAAAITCSRLYIGVHWPTDVAAGIVLGMASGRAGVHLTLRRWRRSDLGRPESAATPVAATDGVEEVEYGEVIQR
jgi:undecaprenyl-diphosphatase